MDDRTNSVSELFAAAQILLTAFVCKIYRKQFGREGYLFILEKDLGFELPDSMCNEIAETVSVIQLGDVLNLITSRWEALFRTELTSVSLEQLIQITGMYYSWIDNGEIGQKEAGQIRAFVQCIVTDSQALTDECDQQADPQISPCTNVTNNKLRSPQILNQIPELTVEPGRHANTLYITDGSIGLAYGVSKLQLILEHQAIVETFALSGKAPPAFLSEYYNNPVLCLPNRENSKVSFGRSKACLISAAYPQIREWLQSAGEL